MIVFALPHHDVAHRYLDCLSVANQERVKRRTVEPALVDRVHLCGNCERRHRAEERRANTTAPRGAIF